MERDTLLSSNFGTSATLAETEKRVITQVYLWMALGLALTGAVAYYTATTPEMLRFVFSSPWVFYGLMAAEIGLVFGISLLLNRISAATATGLFFLYAALNGLTLSVIFLVYTTSSIAGTFFITAGTFGVMSLYGLTTKTDLTKIGNIAMMGLIGIIIASLVNLFFQSSFMSFIISVIGVVVFTALTAYDTQKIKEIAGQTMDGEGEGKVAVMGALTLYLDFINLFLMLLRLLGGRNDD